MRLHGVIRTAEFQENPPGSEEIELVLRVQGVGPGQPRTLVVPFPLLVADETLGPEHVAGRGFEAEAEQDEQARWVVRRIDLASRVLRPSE